MRYSTSSPWSDHGSISASLCQDPLNGDGLGVACYIFTHTSLSFSNRFSNAIHLYVFDRAHFSGTWHFKLPKTGIHRARFLRDSISDLRDSLGRLGSPLIVRHGCPVDSVRDLVEQCSRSGVPIQAMVFQREVTKEEKDVEEALVNLAKEKQIQVGWDISMATASCHILKHQFPRSLKSSNISTWFVRRW